MQHDVNIIIMLSKQTILYVVKEGIIISLIGFALNYAFYRTYVYFINCKLAVQVRCTLPTCEFYKEQLFYTRNVQSCVTHCTISRYVDTSTF